MVVLVLVATAGNGLAEVGRAGVTPASCPEIAWTTDDPAFEALPGAKGLSGTSNGSVYRIEIPDAWNGELVLCAHGLVSQQGPQGARLRPVFPPGGQGQGLPFREHLVAKGFAWAVASASETITGVIVSDATRAQDGAQLTAVVGQFPAYTTIGTQLASVQIEISGGPRPFALEGLANRLIENVTAAAGISSAPHWYRVASNASLRYMIGEGLGLSAASLNAAVRRISADATTRDPRGRYEETIPFDGRFERPVMTVHGTGDLFVPISLQQELKRAVTGAGRGQFLVQRIMRIPGHCNFSRTEAARAFDDLVSWVRTGTRPEGDEVRGDLSNAGLRCTNPLRPGDPGTTRPATAAR